MTDKEPLSEFWTYMGRRERANGGLDLWLTEADEEGFYSKLVGQVIGGKYKVELEENEEGKKSIFLNPRFQSDIDLHESADEWQLKDRAAYLADTSRKTEARMKREGGEDIMKLTLKEIRDMMWRTNDQQRQAMLVIVLKRLGV